MLALRCPSCLKVFKVDVVPQMVSAIVACPFCDQKSQVPGMASQANKDTQVGGGRQSTLHDIASAPQTPVKAGPRRRSLFKKLVLALMLVVASAGGTLALLYFLVWSRTPLSAFATVLPHQTVTVVHVDVVACRKAPEVRDQVAAWERSLAESAAGLELTPPAAIKSWLIACTSAGQTLEVWTLDRPVAIGKKPGVRLQVQSEQAPPVYADPFHAPNGWAVDDEGRLLHGPLALVTEALQRQQAGAKSPAFAQLSRWAKEVPNQPLLWVVVNPAQGVPDGPLPLVHAWNALKKTRIAGLMAAMTVAEAGETQLEGKAFFPTSSDAEEFRTILANDLRELPKLPFAPRAEPGRLAEIVQGFRVTAKQEEMALRSPVPLKLLESGFADAAAGRSKLNEEVRRRVDQAIQVYLGQGEKALSHAAPDKELASEADFAAALKDVNAALDSFAKALDLGASIGDRLNAAKTYLEEVKRFQELLKELRAALDGDDLDKARETWEELTRVRPRDPGLAKLEKAIGQGHERQDFRKACADGDKALAALQWIDAQAAFEKAKALSPQDKGLAVTLKALDGIRDTQRLLDQASKLVKVHRLSELQEASKGMAEAKRGLQTLAAAAVDAPRLKAPRDELCNRFGAVFSAWLEAANVLRGEFEGKVRDADQGNKFAEANAAAAESSKGLSSIKAMVPDAAFLGRPELAGRLKDALKDIDETADRCKGMGDKAQGHLHWDQGLKQLKAARELARKARDDFSHYEPAHKALDEAIATLTRAETFHPTKGIQSSLGSAQAELKRLQAYKTPVDLDFSRARLPRDWVNVGDGWLPAAGWLNKAEVTWLKPKQTAKATLKSPPLEWPRDFEFELVFAAVSLKGQINNDLWRSHPELLTIRFLGEGDRPTLTMTMGRDPKSPPNQDLIGLTVNGKAWSMQRHVKTTDPITLKVVAAKGRGHLAVNDWQKAEDLPSDSRGITLESRNPTTAFPAVLRMSLKLATPK